MTPNARSMNSPIKGIHMTKKAPTPVWNPEPPMPYRHCSADEPQDGCHQEEDRQYRHYQLLPGVKEIAVVHDIVDKNHREQEAEQAIDQHKDPCSQKLGLL